MAGRAASRCANPIRAIGPSRRNIRAYIVVGDYLFDSTINGVLDSADIVVEYILEMAGQVRPAVVAATAAAGGAAPRGADLSEQPLGPHMTPPAPSPAPAAGPSSTLVVRRIRFVEQAPAGVKVARRFRQPRPFVVIEEAIALHEVPERPTWPEPADHLLVVLVPPAAADAWQELHSDWLTAPEHPDAAPAIELTRPGLTIQWRPGRAVVQGRLDSAETILAALCDFAFYESQLRFLETALEAREAGAAGDVAWAYRIAQRDQGHWARIGEIMEQLAHLRLTFVRLEPRAGACISDTACAGRRLLQRLLTRADVPARRTAFDDRLEVCEDLYEGANDRIADYGWARGGHRLEVGIIALLVVEVLLMSTELLSALPRIYLPRMTPISRRSFPIDRRRRDIGARGRRAAAGASARPGPACRRGRRRRP